MNAEWHKVADCPQTKPTALDRESTFGLLLSAPTIAI